ncbi:MAG: response regulator [Chloroflexota bacterium]
MTDRLLSSAKSDILIIDDTPDNLRLLNQMLNRHFKVRLAPNGAAGLTAAHTNPPYLILLDVMMPEMNGYEVAGRLKADPLTCEVPIVFVSALNDVESKIQGFQAGGIDYVTKPFQEEEVLMRVKTHLELSQRYRQARAELNERQRASEAERAQADQELQHYQTKLEATLNVLPDLLFELDAAYRIIDYRTPNSALLYVPPEQFLNRPIDAVMPAEPGAVIRAALDEAREKGWHSGAVYALPAGRKLRWYELSIALTGETDPAQPHFIVLTHDITNRKEAQLVQETVYSIAQAAQTTESLQQLYRQIHQQIAAVMPADNFYITLYYAATDQMQYVYSVDEQEPEWDPEPFPVGAGLTAHVLRTGRPLLYRRGKSLEGVQMLASGAPCQIWLGVPLIAHNRTIGVMTVQDYQDPAAYGEQELHILEYVSSQVATAIDRQQASELLKESNQRFIQLVDNIPEAFWMYDMTKSSYIYISPAFEKIWGHTPHDVYQDPELFTGSILPEDQPLLDEIYAQQERGEQTNVEYRIRRANGDMRWIWDRSFSIADVAGKITRIAGVAADITERKQAEANVAYRQQRLEKVIQLGKNITAITDPRACLSEIYHSIRSGLAYDRVWLYLYDPDSRALQKVFGTDRHGVLQELHGQVETCSAGDLCYTTLQAASGMILVDDYQAEFAPQAGSEMEDVKQYVTLAAWAGDKPVALIAADNLLSQRPLEPVDLEALQLFAGYAGLAIENARMHAELEQRVEERTAEVRHSEATYRALFENSNDGIFLFSAGGEGLQANPQALKLLGCSLEEFRRYTAAGQLLPFIQPDHVADSQQRLQGLLNGEQVPLYERLVISRDGTQSVVEVNLSAVRDDNGKVTLVQSVVRNVTERKKAEAALRESRDKLSAANAALENASRLKDEFLASMSHELRTPLTGILGLSEVLQFQTYGELNEKQTRAVKNIEASGRHLLDLINDILDLSKIEAGRLEMQFASCDVAEICQASLQLIKGLAHQRRHKVSFTMEPPTLAVRADPRRLKQMLVNLLSNAVKFTPEGGELGLEVRAGSDGSLAFCVWDRGIGIKPEDIGKLFKPFIQLDSSLARQYTGTGLGLSLVQRMAEMHGGGVQVESAIGQGSRFTIILPWSEEIAPPLPEPAAGDLSALKHTLVIEDNLLDAESIAQYLREVGIAAVIQPRIAGALELAASAQPSIILLDLHLPDGSGMALLSQLKADPRTRDIPVLIISVDERRGEALRLGALNYLVKPFTQEELRRAIAQAAALQHNTEPVMVISPPAQPRLALVVDDNELVLNTISDFLSSRGWRVVSMQSGFELLERAPDLHPDVVLVDIQMPGMDGIEAIRRLRAHPDQRLSSVPVVAVTALAMTGDREKCLEAGANEYMSKPVSLAQLADLIGRLAEEQQTR